MASTELSPTQIFLDPEVVGFLPANTQTDLAAGRLFLDEHDFLLAAALTRPNDPEHGIQEGESLVVARLTPEGIFAPDRRINVARLSMKHALLQDAADDPEGSYVPLWLSSQRPNVFINADGRMLQVEDHLYVPSEAYGVWLLGNTALHPKRPDYTSFIPQHPEFTIHIGSRPIPSQP